MRLPVSRPRWRPWPYALPALVAGLVLLSGSAVADSRPVRSATGEREIARCIQFASVGRAWLEKTLWGLRDQEDGWIGAEVPNRNGTHDLGPHKEKRSWVDNISVLKDRDLGLVSHFLINAQFFNVQSAQWLFS